MEVFFIDSNFFLQCKDPKNITWEDIVQDKETKEIKIIISRPVQEEIDKLKSDGNKRRAKKARKANSFFRDIILNDEQIVLRRKDLSIIFEFSDTITDSQLENISAKLDITRPDDRIIGEALSTKMNSSDKVKLLSHDTNLLRTAKRNNLDFIIIPDTWLLPPESSSNEKKINELKKRIATLEQQKPAIEFLFYVRDKVYDSMKTISINRYSDLSSDFIKSMFDFIKLKYPLNDFLNISEDKTELSAIQRTLGFKYRIPSQKEILDYKEQKYPKWISEIETSIRDYHKKRNEIVRHLECSIAISNSGTIPVDHAIVEINTIDNILLAPSDYSSSFSELNESFKIPDPPKPPRKRLITPFETFLKTILNNNLKPITLPIPHILKNTIKDRNSFYWKNRPIDYSKSWKFECEELLHKIDPEFFKFDLFLPDNFNKNKITISCRVHGNNLVDPIKKYFKIDIEYNTINLEPEIDNLIKNLILI